MTPAALFDQYGPREEGSERGARIPSGAATDPRALTELFPDSEQLGAWPIQPVTRDDVLMRSQTGAKRLAEALAPRVLHNDGNYIHRRTFAMSQYTAAPRGIKSPSGISDPLTSRPRTHGAGPP